MQQNLTKDLHLHAYKIQLRQELKPTGHVQRREFVNCVLGNRKLDGNFSKKIIFSYEAHFQHDGCVNTQNCRILGKGKPRVTHEKPLHAQQATVWCRFWAGGVIGPYFFENEAGNAVTVNGARYRKMITEFLWPQLDSMEMEDMWFQHDVATFHTAGETTELLRETFPGCVISRKAIITDHRGRAI
jgi:hypothetical protein